MMIHRTMAHVFPGNRDFKSELAFSASRSSGPGGQNVNKVSTKVELRFNVKESFLLTDEEKILILAKLARRINQDDELVLVSQSERTQLKNKKAVVEKFYQLLSKALFIRKRRKITQPSLAIKEMRLHEKRNQSKKKELRSPPVE